MHWRNRAVATANLGQMAQVVQSARYCGESQSLENDPPDRCKHRNRINRAERF
jgi:hypothetical protein